MGFFDGLFKTLDNINPMKQASSVTKYVIVAFVVLAIMFMIWVTVLAKTDMKSAPSTADRLFGVLPKYGPAVK